VEVMFSARGCGPLLVMTVVVEAVVEVMVSARGCGPLLVMTVVVKAVVLGVMFSARGCGPLLVVTVVVKVVVLWWWGLCYCFSDVGDDADEVDEGVAGCWYLLDELLLLFMTRIK
jgi:hypothetical protein